MDVATMDISCCHITIGDAGPFNPMGIQSGVEITKVQSFKINESYKKPIGMAKVILPKGPVCRSTIIGNVTLKGKDVSRMMTEVMQDGVIIERCSAQRLADKTTFGVGQRINIKLGYNGVLKNMLGGCITGCNSDSILEIQCENMTHKLKLRQAPHLETLAKGTMVNEALEGRYNILKDTGLRTHSDMKRLEVCVDKVKVTDSFTIVDILSERPRYKVYRFLRYNTDDDGVIPSATVGHPYPLSEAQSVLPKDESTGPYRIYFNEHVAQSNPEAVKIDPKSLAVTGKVLEADEEFFEVTVHMNPEYDPTTLGGKEFQTVNATQIPKKTYKVIGNTTALGAETRTRVDLSTYITAPCMSSHVGINSGWLIEETTEYFRDYSLSGVTGSVTVFGDFGLLPAVQVELVDHHNPSKNGVYFVEEVTTTFGVGRYR